MAYPPSLPETDLPLCHRHAPVTRERPAALQPVLSGRMAAQLDHLKSDLNLVKDLNVSVPESLLMRIEALQERNASLRCHQETQNRRELARGVCDVRKPLGARPPGSRSGSLSKIGKWSTQSASGWSSARSSSSGGASLAGGAQCGISPGRARTSRTSDSQHFAEQLRTSDSQHFAEQLRGPQHEHHDAVAMVQSALQPLSNFHKSLEALASKQDLLQQEQAQQLYQLEVEGMRRQEAYREQELQARRAQQQELEDVRKQESLAELETQVQQLQQLRAEAVRRQEADREQVQQLQQLRAEAARKQEADREQVQQLQQLRAEAARRQEADREQVQQLQQLRAEAARRQETDREQALQDQVLKPLGSLQASLEKLAAGQQQLQQLVQQQQALADRAPKPLEGLQEPLEKLVAGQHQLQQQLQQQMQQQLAQQQQEPLEKLVAGQHLLQEQLQQQMQQQLAQQQQLMKLHQFDAQDARQQETRREQALDRELQSQVVEPMRQFQESLRDLESTQRLMQQQLGQGQSRQLHVLEAQAARHQHLCQEQALQLRVQAEQMGRFEAEGAKHRQLYEEQVLQLEGAKLLQGMQWEENLFEELLHLDRELKSVEASEAKVRMQAAYLQEAQGKPATPSSRGDWCTPPAPALVARLQKGAKGFLSKDPHSPDEDPWEGTASTFASDQWQVPQGMPDAFGAADEICKAALGHALAKGQHTPAAVLHLASGVPSTGLSECTSGRTSVDNVSLASAPSVCGAPPPGKPGVDFFHGLPRAPGEGLSANDTRPDGLLRDIAAMSPLGEAWSEQSV